MAERLHLKQTQSHDGGLRVVPPLKAIDKARGDGNDVLESAAEGDARDVIDDLNPEVIGRKGALPESTVDGVRGTDSRLGEAIPGDWRADGSVDELRREAETV